MIERKNTPLPWKQDGTEICEITGPHSIHVIAHVESWKNVDEDDLRNMAEADRVYVQMSVPINPKEQDWLETEKANAAFIVQAANAHYELVGVLKQIQESGESGNVDMPQRLWTLLHNALAKAGVK